jgi:hypothetical protein
MEAGRLYSNTDLQIWRCGALQSLAISRAKKRTRIAGTGGIEAVVGAMQMHAQNTRVGLWKNEVEHLIVSWIKDMNARLLTTARAIRSPTAALAMR